MIDIHLHVEAISRHTIYSNSIQFSHLFEKEAILP